MDAKTGKPLRDYDTPAAPNLIDITVDGQRIKAVAQVTKQAFVYAFERVTGKPVWPIEDRPVPASSLPGERASKTQQFPTRPAPIDIQGVSEKDVIDLTPELRREALEIIARHDYGPLYTPPSQRGTIQVPRCRRWCQLVRCRHRSRNRHALCWDLLPCFRRDCASARLRWV
jgi:quinoprotein glucose dehydrogenase